VSGDRFSSTLVVQKILTEDGLVDLDLLNARHRLEVLVGNALTDAHLGYGDGGDLGTGTVNAYFFVSDPHRALPVVLEALRRLKETEGVAVAWLDKAGDTWRVLWPENYPNAFETPPRLRRVVTP
jgi:hypothetical protein